MKEDKLIIAPATLLVLLAVLAGIALGTGTEGESIEAPSIPFVAGALAMSSAAFTAGTSYTCRKNNSRDRVCNLLKFAITTGVSLLISTIISIFV